MAATVKIDSQKSRNSRNETDVDRELELIARLVLDDTATEKDRVQYQRLLSWRRNNMLDLPTLSKRRYSKS